jgi:hypothetical protein
MKKASRQLVLLSLISLLALIAHHPFPRAAAATGCNGGACKLYLPLMAVALPIPQLVAPPNNAQLDTIAPILSWTPLITGTYRIQASTDTSFATTAISATTALGDLQTAQHVMDGNLNPLTTYVWRVGVLFQGSYRFSSIWQFTTPAKNTALLPPHPQLLAPANRSHLPAGEVALSWQAIPNSLYYRVRVYNPDASLFTSAIIAAPATSYHIAGLAAGTTYTWKVKALNQYGWGTYPTAWSFTTP